MISCMSALIHIRTNSQLNPNFVNSHILSNKQTNKNREREREITFNQRTKLCSLLSFDH